MAKPSASTNPDARPLSRRQFLGTAAGGAAGVSETAALVSGATRHFLVNGNYDALLEYNCAHSYAISVGLLADRIESAAATQAEAPKRSTPRRAGHH